LELPVPVNTTLTDTEGFIWDIRSDSFDLPGLGISDGTSDAFDGGMRLIVNGTAVNPQDASVDGREVNTQPVVIDGIAVQRSILVSDATISPLGFARFLDSFTNTTDQVVVITVETVTNSGADTELQLTGESSGDGFLTTADTAIVTDDTDQNGSDPAVMQAFGDGRWRTPA
jgi:hypothetical protein